VEENHVTEKARERKKEREIAKADGADVHEIQMRDAFLIIKTESKKN